MSRVVKVGLIQTSNPLNDEQLPVAEIQEAMFQKHLPWIDKAGEAGVQILGLQEIFNGPYFCPSQDARWYDATEPVPGPTVEALQPIAKKYEMVICVPIYEREQAGVYYNTAAMIDADGSSGALVRGRPARFERAINWTHPAYANKHIVHRNNTEIIRASLDANDYSR